MAQQKVVIKPGINTEYTPTLNEGGWSFSNLIRFKDGLAQKLGGWQRLSSMVLTGTSRALHGWTDLSNNSYLASGSEQRLQLFVNGNLYDITPIRATHNVTPSFSTISTSKTVIVTDPSHGAGVGDWVDIVVTVSVGGILLSGFYKVQTVIDGNNYTIAAATAATATVTNGGAVPSYGTTNTFATVNVTLANHGFSSGSLYNAQISTTVGGITIFGTYAVTSVTNANVFVITPGGAASSTATGSENGGNAQLQYLITSGFASTMPVSGYGVGIYGAGLYGVGSGTTLVSARIWSLDNFGQNLVGNYNGSTLYQWTPPASTFAGSNATTNPALPVTNAPSAMLASFVSNPQQMVVALGIANTGTGGIQDPNLVGWCDAGGINIWTAAASNQAGTYRIPTGSRIVGGLVAPNQNMIWTDIDLWSMQYSGLPFVWGFTKIQTGCGLIATKAAGVLDQTTYWMGLNNFFSAGPGGVEVLKCPVWDVVFKNLNTQQVNKIHCAINSNFHEVCWYYPSASGTGEIDSYVKYNSVEKAWDYGSLVRTAWTDVNPFGFPIGVDGGGLMQQHEVAVDADGTPMGESISTGYFDLGAGEMFMFIERMIPDFIMTGSAPQLLLTVNFLEYPNDANDGVGPVVCGPYPITNGTQSVFPRTRGRQANLEIQGIGLGTFWRMGAVRHNGQPDGRR